MMIPLAFRITVTIVISLGFPLYYGYHSAFIGFPIVLPLPCGFHWLLYTPKNMMRGVGGVCEMCMCLARWGVGGEGREWMRRLGLSFINPVGTGGVFYVCLYLGCGGVGGMGGMGGVGGVGVVGGVGREWVGGLDLGLEGWCYVCVSCESGFFV